MIIQHKYCIIFMCFAILQIICAIQAFKSEKPIGRFTGILNLAIMTPIIANIVIIESKSPVLSYFGYYLSYIGMTMIMLALTFFTERYCMGVDENRAHTRPYFIHVMATVDIVQISLGPLFNHVINLEKTELDGRVFYRDLPRIGLTFHRIVDYVIYGAVLLIFIISIVRTTKLYRQKYIIIFITMILAGASQFAFIRSRIPIDRSIIVHGLFGLVVFYFSILYRPLRLLDAMLSYVVSDMNDAVFVFDNSNKCVWVNDQGYSLLDMDEHKLSRVTDRLFNKFTNITDKGEHWSENRVVDDRYYILEKKAVKTDNKNLDGTFLVIKDDTKRHKDIEREIYNSTHDILTGLYNMEHLYANVENIVHASDEVLNIIFINVKNFKLVKDTFGKDFADVVLIRIANWLKANIKNGVYGRLIGDTFGVCIPKKDFDEDLFLEEMGNFVVKNRNIEHKINIHIGVYEITDTEMDVSVMFDRAHLAITDIEENYKTVIRYYNDELRKTIMEEQRLATDLINAIDVDNIRPYLQPIADKDGKVVGAEALARWMHPDLGFLQPNRFIPVFEKNGMITDLDRHIWKDACRILARWKDTNPDMFISVNISPKDFYFVDVLEEITGLVKEYDIDPKKLRIEITETAMMTDSEEKMAIFNKLRKSGFIVEMDDFGSGYSSLNLLKDMPVDVLKLDMHFLSDENNKRSDTIIRNIINLSNELNIITLTEGVETEEQYYLLKEMGCSLFQGYYFAKPMTVEDFEASYP
ncbi:MAG: EAL domain-containing protein [Eubacterium sp.]|nr:EAL domain-containing protein [Eubacterium sp.]